MVLKWVPSDWSKRRGKLRGIHVIDREHLFTMSIGFPDGVVRHYDVGQSSPDIFAMAEFLTDFSTTRDACLHYRLDIPGDVYCSGLTVIHSFKPDFDLDWEYKEVLSTFFVMSS